MPTHADNVVRLQDYTDGVAAGIRSVLQSGRNEIVTAGPNPEFMFLGNDPWNTNVGTGLVVPTTPSSEINNARYLFLLARQTFGTGEQSSTRCGARLVGIRQYAELIARIPAGSEPLAEGEEGPPAGSTVVFRKEIRSPLWHPPDGNISWHVRVVPAGSSRDTRHPSNADGFMFQDARSPALLFQVPTPYSPPNGGRPWGTALGSSLGNIHELRYPWRATNSEYVLDIPIPTPCDVMLFASVRQNDPTLNPVLSEATDLTQQFVALSEEDKFLVAYPTFAQYGVIAGALVFDENMGRGVP